MSFLTGSSSDEDLSHDNYFMATRILGYRLMHDPQTKTQRHIPFVVLCTQDVSEAKRARLKKDGATVITVEGLYAENRWISKQIQWQGWLEVMAKLRAWELTQYKLILFLDGDTIILKNMDGIFDEPNARPRLPMAGNDTQEWEGHLIDPYVFATVPETSPFHAYPPTAEADFFHGWDYFNAGFFMFAPSRDMFQYYRRVIETENSFDPEYPEQNLLNHAHRQTGMAPWQWVNTTWNLRFPNYGDLECGAASFHDKFWGAQADSKLQPLYDSVRYKMEGFYEAWDATH
jgi:alpha-N-acetylglucosamine transferase